MTSPKNPYFARAIVNRVWRNFMGKGLIEPEDDLRLTNPPSNSELLKALVDDFISHKFDIKHLIRTIMTSQTYQRSSAPVPGNQNDNRFYSHYIVKRLPAEVLLDAFSQATGVPTEFSGYRKGVRSLQLPDSKVASYFLDTFGRPQREQTCACERQGEPSVQQALHLSNGETINQKLQKSPLIENLIKSNATDQEIIDKLFLSALSRHPTEAERARFLGALADSADGRRQAVEDAFSALLTGKEFLFNH
jgi:hypothetical protein